MFFRGYLHRQPVREAQRVYVQRGYPKYYITVIADTAYFARVMSAEWQRKVSGLTSGSLKFMTVCRGRKDLYGLFDRLHESWTADDVPGMLSGVYTLFGELFGSCVATENAEPDPNHDFIVRVSDILEKRFREPLSTGGGERGARVFGELFLPEVQGELRDDVH